jgi:hypothetical protein
VKGTHGAMEELVVHVRGARAVPFLRSNHSAQAHMDRMGMSYEAAQHNTRSRRGEARDCALAASRRRRGVASRCAGLHGRAQEGARAAWACRPRRRDEAVQHRSRGSATRARVCKDTTGRFIGAQQHCERGARKTAQVRLTGGGRRRGYSPQREARTARTKCERRQRTPSRWTTATWQGDIAASLALTATRPRHHVTARACCCEVERLRYKEVGVD